MTDPAEAIATEPFAKDDEPGFEHVAPTTVAPPPPEALEVLRGEAARRSDDSIQKSLTPMRAKPPPPPGARARPTSPPPVPARAAATPTPPAPAPPDDRDDATTISPPPALVGAATPAPHMVAGLRDAPRFPHRPGLLGDLRYPFTVFLGRRRARRELADVEDEITTLRAARAERLAELGRAAIADDRFDQTAVQASREQLMDIEDRRSRHAGAAAAADAELDAIERAKEQELRRIADEIDAAEAEITRIDQELAPIEREAAVARKRAQEVKDTLASIDARITAAKARLVSVKGPAADPAAIEAELASLRADRKAVERDEPAVAAALDAVLPRIAALKDAREAAAARIPPARQAEKDARARAEEQVIAVQARRRVEDRAAADARSASERALAELGERLYGERPNDLTVRLGAVEQQDVKIATAQRRAIELRELIGSVERGPLVRGILYGVVALVLVLTAATLAIALT